MTFKRIPEGDVTAKLRQRRGREKVLPSMVIVFKNSIFQLKRDCRDSWGHTFKL